MSLYNNNRKLRWKSPARCFISKIKTGIINLDLFVAISFTLRLLSFPISLPLFQFVLFLPTRLAERHFFQRLLEDFILPFGSCRGCRVDVDKLRERIIKRGPKEKILNVKDFKFLNSHFSFFRFFFVSFYHTDDLSLFRLE